MYQNGTRSGVNVVGMLRDETRLLRWGSLLYSVFWLAEPIHRHSLAVWTVFLAFYGIFLTGYLRVLRGGKREQRLWLAVLFLLGYLYYPFNPNAGGEFVFAVVVSSFFLRQGTTLSAFRTFAAILLAQAAGLFLETWWLHLPWSIAESVVFFMVIIGLSNFTFARQVFVSSELRKANEEIERLTKQAERETHRTRPPRPARPHPHRHCRQERCGKPALFPPARDRPSGDRGGRGHSARGASRGTIRSHRLSCRGAGG